MPTSSSLNQPSPIPLKFTPKIHPRIQQNLERPEIFFATTQTFSTPLNILYPELIPQNIKKIKSTFAKHRINGQIFFAHKCNQSTAVIKTILNTKTNIDVASENELKHAVSIGFTGDQIEATGPKNPEFILLGLRHNILFNIDSESELQLISKLANTIKKSTPTKILFRLNNFHSTRNYITKTSRFGLSLDQIQYTIKNLDPHFNLLGFSFHLDTVNIEEKAAALEQCLELIEYSLSLGLDPNIINIGGGFKINYLASESEWYKSISNLKNNFIGPHNLTLHQNTFGLNISKGKIHGQLNSIEYYQSETNDLDQILSFKSTRYADRNLGELLSENFITLFVEPGKSLLDNVGLNLVRINFIKTDAQNNLYVGLNMKKSDLAISDQEIFVDPILLKQSSKNSQDSNFYQPHNIEKINHSSLDHRAGVFLIGNLCMENDFIFKRKIFFNTMPHPGDLLVFINTAGYFMDFQSSHTLMQNTATKIILDQDNNIFLDHNFDPALNSNI